MFIAAATGYVGSRLAAELVRRGQAGLRGNRHKEARAHSSINCVNYSEQIVLGQVPNPVPKGGRGQSRILISCRCEIEPVPMSREPSKSAIMLAMVLITVTV